jgi:hypothetical protein
MGFYSISSTISAPSVSSIASGPFRLPLPFTGAAAAGFLGTAASGFLDAGAFLVGAGAGAFFVAAGCFVAAAPLEEDTATP